MIEYNAHSLNGHWADGVATLARAAADCGIPVHVVAVGGLNEGLQAALEEKSIVLSIKPLASDLRPRMYLVAAQLLDHGFGWAHGHSPQARWPYQVLLAARCFREAASLCLAYDRHAGCRKARTVVLTASETLGGTTVILAGVPHVRVVHEVYSWESPVMRAVEHLARRSRRRVVFVCPTKAVALQFRLRYPDARVAVQPFAVLRPDLRLQEDERKAARLRFGFPPSRIVGCLIGGWWRAKDIGTVERAMAGLTVAIDLIIAGSPLDQATVSRIKEVMPGKLLVIPKPLSESRLREVYAACNFSLVTRFSDERKESGLIMDAARYGVPLVSSAHDPELVETLRAERWVRWFPPGDHEALAGVLNGLASSPLPRPDHRAGGRLGMLDAEEQVSRFTALARAAWQGENPDPNLPWLH